MAMINGHYWIIDEQTGETIYDPEFAQEKHECKVQRAIFSQKVYRQAPAERQREMVGDLSTFLAPILRSKANLPHEFWEPRYLQCGMNCLRYKVQGGKGKIVYGDAGHKKKDGSIYWAFNDTEKEEDWRRTVSEGRERYMASLDKKGRRQLRLEITKLEAKNKKNMELYIKWAKLLK